MGLGYCLLSALLYLATSVFSIAGLVSMPLTGILASRLGVMRPVAIDLVFYSASGILLSKHRLSLDVSSNHCYEESPPAHRDLFAPSDSLAVLRPNKIGLPLLLRVLEAGYSLAMSLRHLSFPARRVPILLFYWACF